MLSEWLQSDSLSSSCMVNLSIEAAGVDAKDEVLGLLENKSK